MQRLHPHTWIISAAPRGGWITQDPHRSPVPQVGAETVCELQAEQKGSWISFACPFLSQYVSGLAFVSLRYFLPDILDSASDGEEL